MENQSFPFTLKGSFLKTNVLKKYSSMVFQSNALTTSIIPKFMETSINKSHKKMKLQASIFKQALLLFFSFICINITFAQAAGDYRAVANGNWNVNATWERYNGAAWVAAAAFPTNADGQTTIQPGITVTVNVAITTDQLVVDGTINIAGGQTLTLNNGAGIDMIINAGGNVNIGGTLTGTGSADVSGVLVNSGTYTLTGALNIFMSWAA